MKLHSQIMLGLLSSMFVLNVASADDRDTKMKGHRQEMNCDGMGMHGDMKMGHSAQAQKHLSELKSKLTE